MCGSVIAAFSLADVEIIRTFKFHADSDEDHQVCVFSFLVGQFIFHLAYFVAFLIMAQLLEHFFGLQNCDGSFYPFDHSSHYLFDIFSGQFRVFVDNFEPDFDFSFG